MNGLMKLSHEMTDACIARNQVKMYEKSAYITEMIIHHVMHHLDNGFNNRV